MIKNKILISAGIAVSIIAIVVWYAILPPYKQITSSQDAIKEKQSDLESKKLYYDEIMSLKNSFMEIDKESIEKLGRVLPKDENIINYLPEMEVMLTQNGMNIGGINFENPSAGNKTSDKNLPKHIKGDIKPTKVSIEAKGSYEAFRNFLTSAEQEERLSDIINIGFAPENDAVSEALQREEQSKFVYSIELYIYSSK